MGGSLFMFLMLLIACGDASRDPGSPYQGVDHELPDLTVAEQARLLDAADFAIAHFVRGGGEFTPDPAFDGIHNRAYVILWQQGRKLYSWWSQADNLSAAVYRATSQVLEHRPPSGAAGLEVHIQVLGPDIPWAEEGYRHGIHGVSMRRTRAMNYYPSWAVETNVKAEKLIRRLQERLEEADPAPDNGGQPIQVYYFPAQHFSRPYQGSQITAYYKGSTPQLDGEIDAVRFERLHALARQWLTGALAPDGQFRYLYYPSRDEYPEGKNNMIRQLMSSRGLAQLAAANPELEPLHRRNLDYMMTHWYREEGDKAYILFKDKSKLGANAMALRTLVYSPWFDSYTTEARRLAYGILALQQEDGAFLPWYVEPSYVYSAERLLTFYSGEALLALFEYYLKTGDDRVLAAARRSQDYYVTRYADQIDEHYYPAYVPWHAQSLSLAYEIFEEPRYAQAVFAMTDKLLEIQNQDGGIDPYYRGRFYNPATPQFGSPHSSSDAVYTEGLAYAYALALSEQDSKRATRYREALLLGLHNLDNLQYRGQRMYFVPSPRAVEGALRIHTTDNKVRVDTTQHALDAFDKVAQLLASGDLVLPE